VNQINAQTGKKLTQEQAEALIHAAESLESSLNNPIEPNSVRLGGLLKVRRMEGSDLIEVRWPGGSLQSSESPTGPWENVSIDANVLRIPVSQSRRFYRVTETKTVR
jgi:hypothetical protein